MRIASVQKKFTANATQTRTTAMSRNHSSSAYSFDCVMPSGSVIAAPRMISCHPHRWTLLKRSDAMRVFSSRCVE